MSRVIGMDIHRTFAEVVFCEDGRLRWHGRVDMTGSGLEGFELVAMDRRDVGSQGTEAAGAVRRRSAS
jgi:transposase